MHLSSDKYKHKTLREDLIQIVSEDDKKNNFLEKQNEI